MCPEPSSAEFSDEKNGTLRALSAPELEKAYVRALCSRGTNCGADGGTKGGDDRNQANQGNHRIGPEHRVSADLPVNAQRQHEAAATSTGSTIAWLTAATESKGDECDRDDFLATHLDRLPIGL